MFRLFAIYIPAPTTGIFFSNTREKNNNKLLIMNFKKKMIEEEEEILDWLLVSRKTSSKSV